MNLTPRRRRRGWTLLPGALWLLGASAAQAAVFVTFQSEPTGAQVFVDDVLVCDATPCRKRVDDGPRTVRFELAGHDRAVVAWSGSTTVQGKLSRHASVRVRGVPAGTTFNVDDKGHVAAQGETQLQLPPGAQALEVVDPCVLGSARFDAPPAGDVVVDVPTAPRAALLDAVVLDDGWNEGPAHLILGGENWGDNSAPRWVPRCNKDFGVHVDGWLAGVAIPARLDEPGPTTVLLRVTRGGRGVPAADFAVIALPPQGTTEGDAEAVEQLGAWVGRNRQGLLRCLRDLRRGSATTITAEWIADGESVHYSMFDVSGPDASRACVSAWLAQSAAVRGSFRQRFVFGWPNAAPARRSALPPTMTRLLPTDAQRVAMKAAALSGTGVVGTRGRGGGEGGLGPKIDRDVTMTQGTPTILGSLDPEIVRHVVREHAGQLRSCYESELTRTPGISGKVIMKWLINGDGRVMQAQVAETQMKNANVEDCLATRIKTWSFPKPKGGGIVVVTYPFVFQQPG